MEQIPGYGSLEQIGSGATATVYRALQEAIGREVAVKVLSAPSLDAKSQKRFGRESRALGALGWHPNIVVLFDAGSTPAGAPFIAMEYLSGGSLAERGPMDPSAVTAIGIKIAGALQCAHDAGVLHRDVKPANILLSPFQEAKLADFGISGLVDATHTTGGGMTLAHVAPEVVDGRQATTRSDVYSLASTMFELLTGRAPFESGNPEAMVALLLRIMDAPVPDCRPDGVPPPLASVLEHALGKDPDRRLTAADFGLALQEVQQAMGWPATALPMPAERGDPNGKPQPSQPSRPGQDTLPMDARPELPR